MLTYRDDEVDFDALRSDLPDSTSRPQDCSGTCESAESTTHMSETKAHVSLDLALSRAVLTSTIKFHKLTKFSNRYELTRINCVSLCCLDSIFALLTSII